MRFCLHLAHSIWRSGDAAAIERTFATIRQADELGFDSVWLSEDPDGWDAFAVLAAAARDTSHIRVGTGVTNPFLRHPNLIAASVATLGRLSGGRAFLGLGRGQPEWYAKSLGIPVGSPLQAIEVAIGLLRQWWQPPHIASGAPPFLVKGWERTLSPASLPPIYIAATGERVLALAGRLADGVRFNELASDTFYADAIATTNRAAREAGRRSDELVFFAHPSITVTDDPERELERKKATVAMIHALPGMDRQLRVPGIDVDAIMAEVRRHMRTDEVLARGGGFAELRRAGDLPAAKRAIPLELMDKIAIVGSPAVIRQRLASLAGLGVTHCFFALDRNRLPPDEVSLLLREIAPG